MLKLILVSALALCSSYADKLDPLLKALHQVEASGRLNPPDGDSGQAIGPFQIHQDYWHDALEFSPGLGGKYADCHTFSYANGVVRAYLKRYGQRWIKQDDFIALARIHNGGPGGLHTKATLPYAKKVKKFMAKPNI